uniref:Uncharacterized protein n=1 Tax=Biomphalaria glabrata TaxID=6526 RepID=A0A2C9M6N6_BIOGL
MIDEEVIQEIKECIQNLPELKDLTISVEFIDEALLNSLKLQRLTLAVNKSVSYSISDNSWHNFSWLNLDTNIYVKFLDFHFEINKKEMETLRAIYPDGVKFTINKESVNMEKFHKAGLALKNSVNTMVLEMDALTGDLISQIISSIKQYHRLTKLIIEIPAEEEPIMIHYLEKHNVTYPEIFINKAEWKAERSGMMNFLSIIRRSLFL